MTKKIKKILLYVLKVIVSIALVWIAFRKIDPDNLTHYLSSLPFSLAVIVFLLGILNLFLQYIRFYFIIEECRHNISMKDLIKVFFMGFAFRLTIPGGHGEAAKMLFIPGAARNRITAYGIEKLSISVLIVFLFGPAALILFPEKTNLLWISAIPVVGTILLYVLKNKPWIQKWLLSGTRYRLISVKTIIMTLAVYAVFITQYWVLLRLFGTDWITVAAVCVFVMGAAALPVSVSGLGIRENTSAYLLSGFGIAPAVGVGVPLMIFCINVVLPAIAGGILIVLTKRKY
ncbi:MAG TPA: flippase-like domain-containing protein [Candidatus Marinimicrobia bacterium]|nr:flippase-like domain-containing protein [Candidatus Neomarinimicrobiota bacterium]